MVTSRDDGQASSPAWMLGWGSRGRRPPVHILAPTFFEPGRWFWGGGWETCACPLIPALPLCDLRHHPTLSGLFFALLCRTGLTAGHSLRGSGEERQGNMVGHCAVSVMGP